MENLWLSVTLLALAGSVYGLFVFVFRKGRRKQGLKIAGGSVVTFVVAGLLMAGAGERAAQEAGFEDAAAMRAAEAAARDAAAAEKAAEEARIAAETAAREEAAAAEERRKGFHCLSAWDGSHADLKRAVRGTMRDPESFEHIETRVAPVNDEGYHILSMTFRARNGFGGMNVAEAIGAYRNDDCSFEVISVE